MRPCSPPLSLFPSSSHSFSRVPTAVREPLTRIEIGCYRMIVRFLCFFLPFFPSSLSCISVSVHFFAGVPLPHAAPLTVEKKDNGPPCVLRNESVVISI